jgi:tripeptidyl-peptidase-1
MQSPLSLLGFCTNGDLIYPQNGREDASMMPPLPNIPLRFALVQPNIENIEEYLYEVSHPDSPNYGKHWNASQVAVKFAPSQQSVDAVRDWILENGIQSYRVEISPSRGWLQFQATGKEGEDLLHSTYHVYGHETGTEHVSKWCHV